MPTPRPVLASLSTVLVVPPDPEVRLVASFRRPIEPLVHGPEPVYSAREGRIGVINDAVLQRKGAHAGSFAGVGRPVGAGRPGDLVCFGRLRLLLDVLPGAV